MMTEPSGPTRPDEAASARAKGNVRRGKVAEQAVARYLRQWWPGAVRAVRTASSAAADPGDIAGVPGVVISVKDCATESWGKWWSEVDAMREADPAALGVVVLKRRGAADAGSWWVHLPLCDLASLLGAPDVLAGEAEGDARITLSGFARALRNAGYAPGASTGKVSA